MYYYLTWHPNKHRLQKNSSVWTVNDHSIIPKNLMLFISEKLQPWQRMCSEKIIFAVDLPTESSAGANHGEVRAWRHHIRGGEWRYSTRQSRDQYSAQSLRRLRSPGLYLFPAFFNYYFWVLFYRKAFSVLPLYFVFGVTENVRDNFFRTCYFTGKRKSYGVGDDAVV